MQAQTAVNETLIRDVVNEVLARLGHAAGPGGPSAAAGQATAGDVVATGAAAAERPAAQGGRRAGAGGVGGGVFTSVDEAVAAATEAQRTLAAASLEVRAAAVDAIRTVMRRDRPELARLEFEETRIGKLAHKEEKLEVAAGVPGLEMLRTEATSGDHGLTVTEYAPWGVIGVVTPVTHSVPTLGCNAIMMIAAGNAVVCNPHPGGARCAAEATRRWNALIRARTGIDHLICTILPPTLETAQQIFRHPGVALLCATGGAAMARAALASGKRAIVAGPGNPPVVVDETANLAKAASGILAGAGYDNNLLCIGEKEVFVVAAVADELLAAMSGKGGFRLTPAQMAQIAQATIVRDPQSGHYVPRREYVGQDPQVLGRLLGLEVPPHVKCLYGETDEGNPLVPCEQMMPVLPVVRCRDVDEAIAKAVHYEHGFRHTAIMWSRNVENLTRMGRACGTTLYVKNGPCVAGLGVGGQGYASFSIATPTGEGVTSPLTFTRYRRCTMVDSLRIF